MRRTDREFKEELQRRTKAYRAQQKKRRKMMLTAALCLVLCVFTLTAVPAIVGGGFTKSADKDPKRRRIGFLNELRRLNVAMTRCKKMLILIGDMEFLRSCRHCDTDAYGEEIYNKSERQFSDFINKMLKDVDNGRGERISYHTFLSRIKGGDA